VTSQAYADDICRYAAVFEPAFRRARHAQPEFSFDILCAKPGRIFFNDESADFSIVIFCPHHFHICDRRIADPAFAAV